MEVVQPSLLEKINRWIRESVMLKLFSIGFMILILMIPQSLIESLIVERQQRAASVIEETASEWSGSQNLKGPILVVPYTHREKIDKGKDGIEIRTSTEKAFFLPETLDVQGAVDAQKLHRGIFDAAVYKSILDVKGAFAKPDFAKLSIAEGDVQWENAHLIFGITDMRGINDNPIINSGTDSLVAEPVNDIGVKSAYQSNDADRDAIRGIVAKLPWHIASDFQPSFTMKLALKGSTSLFITPVGKTTDVVLKGPWAAPSFEGQFLPQTRNVTDAGFDATWKVLHYNRPFAQQWTGIDETLTGADFGVRLVIPVDQYQKSIRSAKYGILIILLTFVSLFLVEIIRKVRIHPFQYILVGAALIIYYSLLISLSEHVGYDAAYGISSVATIVLVALYSMTFMESRKLVFIFAGLLSFFYGFIFVIIQMEEFSLLLGSVGLFLTLGLLMYFSRGIRWYKEEPGTA